MIGGCLLILLYLTRELLIFDEGEMFPWVPLDWLFVKVLSV